MKRELPGVSVQNPGQQADNLVRFQVLSRKVLHARTQSLVVGAKQAPEDLVVWWEALCQQVLGDDEVVQHVLPYDLQVAHEPHPVRLPGVRLRTLDPGGHCSVQDGEHLLLPVLGSSRGHEASLLFPVKYAPVNFLFPFNDPDDGDEQGGVTAHSDQRPLQHHP